MENRKYILRAREVAQWVMYTRTWNNNHGTQSINQSIIPGVRPGQIGLKTHCQDKSVIFRLCESHWGFLQEWKRSERAMRESTCSSFTIYLGWIAKEYFKVRERLEKIFYFDLRPFYAHIHTRTPIWTHKQKYKEGGEDKVEKCVARHIVLREMPKEFCWQFFSVICFQIKAFCPDASNYMNPTPSKMSGLKAF